MSDRDAMVAAFPDAEYVINTQTDQRMVTGQFINEQPIASPPPPPSPTLMLMGV